MNFLHTIAQDILNKYGTDLHNITVVFPNKRASLFLNQTLIQLSDRPLWSPRYITISELFCSMTSLQLADRIKLICELHKSYCTITGKNETLEQFYGWGELMLSDFDDIDKHLADAKMIFTLLSDLHELDSVDYLSPEQVEVLKGFFRNFTESHTTILKERFLELWNKFYDIYTHFRQSLLSQGLAYEGMLYREVVENEVNVPVSAPVNVKVPVPVPVPVNVPVKVETFLFVGFNLLTPVEQLLITRLEGKIYNDDDNSCPPSQLSVISSPTDDLQARYVSQWLTPERINAGRRTAIVLADESLLPTVLHCLPADISLNITTGFPLSQAPVTSLIQIVTILLQRDSYTLHNVNSVLRHPLAKYISPCVEELHKKINDDLIYYLTPEEVSPDDTLRQLFLPLANKEDTLALTDRLLWLTKTIALNIQNNQTNQSSQDQDFSFLSESLFRMFTLLNRLRTLITEEDITLPVTLYTKLLDQVIQTTTIPFHGEPIEGIQIMGVLETRNLDFDHVLLLSCNEGNLPARINDSSFLPHSVRQGYNLTTIENKVSIYHYYFDRLLQRTKDVTILYNNSTNDGKTGEMSRFVLQLLAESPIPIQRYALQASVGTTSQPTVEVAKTQDMVNKLLSKEYLSPSALGKYLRCPMSFYYTYIEDIRDDEDGDQEEMDNRAFGNIFHAAAELLYKDFEGKAVPRDYIERLIHEKGHPTLKRIAEKAFRQELFNIKDDKRKTPRLNGLQVINYEIVITFLLNLLRYDLTLTRLQIVSLEHKYLGTITVDGKPITIGGKIDRLNTINDEDGKTRLRVIDYKTGRLRKPILNLNSVDEIFMPEKIASHTDYFLQALLYASILEQNSVPVKVPVKVPVNVPVPVPVNVPVPVSISTGLLYVQHATNEDYTPLLHIANQPIVDAAQYQDEFLDGLSRLISEILNPSVPFRCTENTTLCTNCPFFTLCH
ncbi:MAG: PD-(D/E)XK nuclease family protein [Prevotella sp.]|nr:PD-(D/E)XK nuclease family protein [Prevotella sp.]